MWRSLEQQPNSRMHGRIVDTLPSVAGEMLYPQQCLWLDQCLGGVARCFCMMGPWGSVCPHFTASLRVSADLCRRHERSKMIERRYALEGGFALRRVFAEPAREGDPFESSRFPKRAVALSQADRSERPGQQQGPT